MLTPPSGRASITKEKFMRKFSPKRSSRMYLKEPSVSQFMIDLQEMPLASEDQKEFMKMQSIFNQFLEQQTRKRQLRRSQQEQTLEELTKQRAQKLEEMDVKTGGQMEMEERKQINKLQSQKIFEDNQFLQKVKKVVIKTKVRINNKHLNREQKFKKNLELFQDMDSYLEVKDLLQRLNQMDGSLSGSKDTSRILDSRQVRIAQVISEIGNEEATNEDDFDYQKALIRDHELIAKAGTHLRKSLQYIHRANEKQESDLMERISKELLEQLQDTNGVDLEDGSQQADRITQYISKMLMGNQDFNQNLSSKKYRKLRKNSMFTYDQNFEEESSKQIYDRFKVNSDKIMNLLVNSSKQIYNKKMSEGIKPTPSNMKLKSKSVAEIRHEPQKKSVFFLQKSLVNLDLPDNDQIIKFQKSMSLVEKNKVVNPLRKEHDELLNLRQKMIKIDTNNLMDLKQRIYKSTEKLPKIKQTAQLHQDVFSTAIESPLDLQFESRIKRSMSNAKSLLEVSERKIHIKPKFKQLFPKVPEQLSSLPATPPLNQVYDTPHGNDQERSPDVLLDQSIDSTSNSHISSPSQTSNQRYRTNKNVRKQRKEIQFLIDKIEQTKDNIVKEKRGYQKRINEIESIYKNDMDRFKPEIIESLRYIRVNKSMDPIKHRLKKKK